MEDLSDQVTQQALISKMQDDQQDMLRTMIDPTSNINKSAVEQSAANMAKHLIELNEKNFSQMLSTDEVTIGQMISTVINPLDSIVDAFTGQTKKGSAINTFPMSTFFRFPVILNKS